MSGVWIVLQQREGKLHRLSREAVAAGQRLAVELGERATAVLVGQGLESAVEEVSGYDLESVRAFEDAKLDAYRPETYVGALAPVLRREQPGFVVFPHTYQSVEYVPRLAHALNAAFVPEVLAFERRGEAVVWKRPVLAGKLHAWVRVRHEGTVLASVQAGAFPADSAIDGRAETEIAAVDLSALQLQRELLGVEQVAGDEVDLSRAEVIIAVGRGVGGGEKMEQIRELAGLLGAEIGASRPVIDSGWLPRDRQIGSSGQTVAPKLYLALGISGAIQHLVGMKGAGCVVAVNKDASAPIFGLASYGIVGDLHEVVPALVEAIREARG